MSDHDDISIQLSALLDGELPPDDAAALRKQIDADPALAEELAQLQSVRTLLGQLPKSTLHASFAQDVAARIARKRFAARWTRIAAAAAVVITTTVIVLTATNPETTNIATKDNAAASVETLIHDALKKDGSVPTAASMPAPTAAPAAPAVEERESDSKRAERLGTGIASRDLDTERRPLLEGVAAPVDPTAVVSPTRSKSGGDATSRMVRKSKSAKAGDPEFFDPAPTGPAAIAAVPAKPVDPVVPVVSEPRDSIATRSIEPKPVAPICGKSAEPRPPAPAPILVAAKPAPKTHGKAGAPMAMKKARTPAPDLSGLNVQTTETVNLYTDNLPREQKALETFFASNKITFANTQNALRANAPRSANAAIAKGGQGKRGEEPLAEVEYVLSVDNRQLAALNAKLLPQRALRNSNVSQLSEPTHRALLSEADMELTARGGRAVQAAPKPLKDAPNANDKLREKNEKKEISSGAVQSPGETILAGGEKQQAATPAKPGDVPPAPEQIKREDAGTQSQTFSAVDLRQRALRRQIRLVVRYRAGFETLPRYQQTFIQTRNLAPSQLQNQQTKPRPER